MADIKNKIMMLMQSGSVVQARNLCLKTCKKESSNTEYWYMLGTICAQMGDYAASEKYYKKVISLNPSVSQAYFNIAAAQRQQGKLKATISSLKKTIQIQKDYINAYLELASAYQQAGEIDSAIQQLKDASVVSPKSIEPITNLALLYEKMLDIPLALEIIERAYKIGSDNEVFLYNYAKIQAAARHYSLAEEIYKSILEKNSNFSEAAVNLGNIYLQKGDAVKGYEVYQQACSSRPDFHGVCSNMLSSLNYSSHYSVDQIRDKHFEWANTIESNITQLQSTSAPIDTSKPLRIGFVSPDFREHSVAYFVLSIIKLINREKFVNYCYSDVRYKDEMTLQFEEFSDYWCEVITLDDVSLAKQIQKDKIDILIDLCGHISGNRMALFALKPARTQVSYCGYPNTTGLRAIDYRLVDKITDKDTAHLLSETPVFLDKCFLNYTASKHAPAVAVLPATKNSYVTFGSFNNIAKMTDEVIQVWAKVVNAVPNSRLCIKARQYEDDVIKQEHIQRFVDAGVNESRLDLIGYSNTTTEHLQSYSLIDISLNTYPYNGTTTTFEAFWMGVPVISIQGVSHVSRVGATILTHLGRTNWLANNEEEYISIASKLASDIKLLSNIRQSLRQELQQSTLMAASVFVEDFESKLIEMAQ